MAFKRLVPGAPLVLLEEQELAPEIAGRLPGEVRDQLRAVALPVGSVACRALGGRRAPALDGRRVRLDRGRLAGLAREVGGDVVHAEVLGHLRVGLHLRRRPAAGRVVRQRLLQVRGVGAGQDRHRVPAAVPREAVAGATHEGLLCAGPVEGARQGRGDRGQQSPAGRAEEQPCQSPHRSLLRSRVSSSTISTPAPAWSHRPGEPHPPDSLRQPGWPPSQGCRSRCWSATRSSSARPRPPRAGSASARSGRPCRCRSGMR